MVSKREWQAALAAIAACSGIGFSSGQGIVLFFAQAGRASWLGIPIASLIFGLLAGLVCRCSRRTVPIGRFAGYKGMRFLRLLNGLLMTLIAVMMLRRTGELGALALPVKRSAFWGSAIALMLAVIINAGGKKVFIYLGGFAAAFAIAFHGALALDPRTVRLPVHMETDLRWKDSLSAAVLLAILHGCMNGAAAGNLVQGFARGAAPARTGFVSGSLMFVQLMCANAAVFSGGEALYGAKLPTVILAARWGLTGFWMSALFMYFCAAATLAAALRALTAQMIAEKRMRAGCICYGR